MAATIGSLVLRIGASVEGLRSDMGKATGIVRAGASSMEGALSRIKFGLASAFGGFGIANLTGQFLAANRATDTFRRGMETVTGSAARAEQELKFVQDISNRLGLSLTDAADAYLQLQAAAKGTRLEGEPSRRIFEGVALAMSRLGRTSADISGALLAVQQIISKGKVSAEELRGQLGERLPGAFQIAAKAAGVTTAELDKLLKDGKLIADDFLPKFAKALTDAYGGGESAVSGLTAEVNRLKNEWTSLLVTLGDTGAFSFIIQSLRDMNSSIREFYNQINSNRIGGGIVEDLNRQILKLEETRKQMFPIFQNFNPFGPSITEIDQQLEELKRRRDAAVLSQQQLERRGKVGPNAPPLPEGAPPLPARGGEGRIETPRADITFNQSDFARVALAGGLPESAVAETIAGLPGELAKLIPRQGEGFVSSSVGGALIEMRETLRKQTNLMAAPPAVLPKGAPVDVDQFAEREAYSRFRSGGNVPLVDMEDQFSQRAAYIREKFGREGGESAEGAETERASLSELQQIREILKTRTFPAAAQ